MIKLLHFVTLISMICVSTLFAQPDPNETAILDDFEDTYDGDVPNQGNLGAVKGILESDLASRGGGYWYSYKDNNGSIILNGAGDEITSTNAKDMIEDGALHVFLKTGGSSNANPYAGVGIMYSGRDDGDIHDLTKLTAIKLKIKGSEKVAMRAETQDVAKNFTWGYYQSELSLTGSWVNTTVPIADLKAPEWSEPSTKEWKWEGGADADNTGRKEANKLSFQVKEGNDAELYLDDIILDGMVYDDFTVDSDILGEHDQLVGKAAPRFSGNTVTYTLNNPQTVSLAVYDIKGKPVKELCNRKDVPGTYRVTWNGENVAGSKVSNGLYIFRFKSGTQVWNIPFSFVK